MKNLADTEIGKIVTENYRAALVLTAHRIDFCCGGGVTLEEACHKQHADLNQVMAELSEVLKTPDSSGYAEMDIESLIGHIVSEHHRYVSATAPALRTYLDKLCNVHGANHPELFQIRDLFYEGVAALLDHMNREELVLFPYISAMVQSLRNSFPLSPPHFGDIENPLHVMEQEHEEEGSRFKKIAELSNHYQCPTDGCQTYKVAYAMLSEFEDDLHTHIHLENNILFPEARKLYNQFQFNQ